LLRCFLTNSAFSGFSEGLLTVFRTYEKMLLALLKLCSEFAKAFMTMPKNQEKQ